MINAIAGAGALLTFPILLALGLPPLSANVTNSIGVVPGSIATAVGFRAELSTQKILLRRLVPLTAVGSLAGGLLLFVLPSRTFGLMAPGLLGIGAALSLAQPFLARRLATVRPSRNTMALMVTTFLTAVYGGYFGSGVGVIFFALLGVFAAETIHRMNAVKTVLQALANGAAGLLFCFIAPVNWPVAITLGFSTAVGGPLGARLSRHIPAAGIRYSIGVIGLAAATTLAFRGI
jgi:uncharacterized membrane protein YfcA